MVWYNTYKYVHIATNATAPRGHKSLSSYEVRSSANRLSIGTGNYSLCFECFDVCICVDLETLVGSRPRTVVKYVNNK